MIVPLLSYFSRECCSPAWVGRLASSYTKEVPLLVIRLKLRVEGVEQRTWHMPRLRVEHSEAHLHSLLRASEDDRMINNGFGVSSGMTDKCCAESSRYSQSFADSRSKRWSFSPLRYSSSTVGLVQQ